MGLAAAVFQSLSLVVFCGSWRRRRWWRLCSGAVGFGASRWVGGRVGFVCGCVEELVGLRAIKVGRRRGVRRVELELVSGLRVEFTDRERALGQVEEWAERGTRFPVVIFGPEGCGKSAFLRQVSAMLKELGFDVFYLHPLEREFRAEVAVPDIRREFVRFVERALGENALVAWAAFDFVRKLQRARWGRIAVVADDVFQAVGLGAVAGYVKALLNLVEYPASRYERLVVLVAAGEGVSRREVGRHLWAEVAPMWNMSREGFQQLYDKIPSPKPPLDEAWRLTGGIRGCCLGCMRPGGTWRGWFLVLSTRRGFLLVLWLGGGGGLRRRWRTRMRFGVPTRRRS